MRRADPISLVSPEVIAFLPCLGVGQGSFSPPNGSPRRCRTNNYTVGSLFTTTTHSNRRLMVNQGRLTTRRSTARIRAQGRLTSDSAPPRRSRRSGIAFGARSRRRAKSPARLCSRGIQLARIGSRCWPSLFGRRVTATRNEPARSPRTALRWRRDGPGPAGPPLRHGGRSRSWLNPFKKGRTDPDQGCPFLDGNLEIIRHAHRQLHQGQVRKRPQRVANFRSRMNEARASSAVVPSAAIVINPTIGIVRHSAIDAASLKICSIVQPCLLASPEVFTCKQTAGGSLRLFADPRQGLATN